MNKKGQIIIIEDDMDDRDVLSMIFKDLNYPNELQFFEDGDTALEYLNDENVYPFLILSDINLPKLNGFELRKMVHTNEGLMEKCIPYLFLSTSVNKQAVTEAYKMSVQGFFLKPDNYEKIKYTIKTIMQYWLECYAPNTFEN